jgi:hypothetical protein
MEMRMLRAYPVGTIRIRRDTQVGRKHRLFRATEDASAGRQARAQDQLSAHHLRCLLHCAPECSLLAPGGDDVVAAYTGGRSSLRVCSLSTGTSLWAPHGHMSAEYAGV